MRTLLLVAALFIYHIGFTQPGRWQQRVEYTMQVHLDVKTHRVNGTQKLVYFNNSPDTLRKVYYHLYFNAFQPGSMMDVRSRTIADPDGRVTDRISKLKDDEMGYQHIQQMKQDGKELSYTVNGTLLEVQLNKPLLPKSKTMFDMTFESQVPIQIRRSGRNSKEGIAYSMTQWYPKLAEYDHQGWHAYQYVAREFHGVWGDFDVKITLDPAFVVGGTGILQNADKVGHGYEKPGSTVNRPSGDLTWHFVAKDVIDFAWAADPDYTHTRVQVPAGPEVHFLYQKNEKTSVTWKKLEEYIVKHFQFMNNTFGQYPYEVYSVIQGGDGGMEYPMCTLILGEGSFDGVAGTALHEICHSWYQAVLATNESLYPWMDEGFTTFAEDESWSNITNTGNTHAGSYMGYVALVKSGLQEPISQHSDHYTTNRAYGIAAYSMGSLFLNQLKYIVGKEHFYKGMVTYYNTWKFRHPEPNDFIRIMENASGLQLHWFMRYWVNTTKRIDYTIKSVAEREGKTFVTIERLGELPMPMDVLITFADGSKEWHYLPMNETLGIKPAEDDTPRTVHEAWPWVNPSYTFEVNKPVSGIAKVEIDPTQRLADTDRKNNTLELGSHLKAYRNPTR